MDEECMVTMEFPDGDVTVSLSREGDRLGTWLYIDGVPYHLERITCEQLQSEYVVDGDPDYAPRSDSDGYCMILAPFSQ